MKYKQTYTPEQIAEAYYAWANAKNKLMREKEWSLYVDRRDGYVDGHHWAKHTKQYRGENSRESFIVGLQGGVQ